MGTKVATKMHKKPQTASQLGDDSSIIVDMDKPLKDTKGTTRNSNVDNIQEGSNSIYYEASLTLDNVKPYQSGNYTCGPSNSLSASVRLHITQGNQNL